VPIDRHSIGSQHHRPESGLQKRDVISHQEGDTIAASYTESFEAAYNLTRSPLALVMSDKPIAADNPVGSRPHIWAIPAAADAV
jgi:hypothetical protein